jgi:hypothetical protein
MKVAQVKELLNAYSDEDELMIAWNDKTQFEYILEKELPNEIWQEAVRVFDRADLMDFNDECHSLVVTAKDKIEGNE